MGIEKRINHKEKQMFNMRTEIKKLLQRAKTPSQKKVAKRQATLKLKRIKMMEKQVQSDSNQLTRLTQMEMGLANQAFKDINMDIDDVQDVIDLNEDMMDQQSEITEALGQQMGDDILDDDELEAEFAALEEENALEEMDRLPGVPNRVPSLGDSGRKLAQQSIESVLPVAPTGQISTPMMDEDDDELMALEAEMLAT